jgi:hypothetical protein
VVIATGYGKAQRIFRMSTEWYSGYRDWLRNSRVDIGTSYGIARRYDYWLRGRTVDIATVYGMLQWI